MNILSIIILLILVTNANAIIVSKEYQVCKSKCINGDEVSASCMRKCDILESRKILKTSPRCISNIMSIVKPDYMTEIGGFYVAQSPQNKNKLVYINKTNLNVTEVSKNGTCVLIDRSNNFVAGLVNKLHEDLKSSYNRGSKKSKNYMRSVISKHCVAAEESSEVQTVTKYFADGLYSPGNVMSKQSGSIAKSKLPRPEYPEQSFGSCLSGLVSALNTHSISDDGHFISFEKWGIGKPQQLMLINKSNGRVSVIKQNGYCSRNKDEIKKRMELVFDDVIRNYNESSNALHKTLIEKVMNHKCQKERDHELLKAGFEKWDKVCKDSCRPSTSSRFKEATGGSR